jgi:ribokinase
MTEIQPKIVCLGSLNMDLLIQVQRAPHQGETVQGQSIHYLPGGKGANQAVSCARQGAQVSMVGRVGSDHHGVTLCNALEQDYISVAGVEVDPNESTGVAMVMVDDEGQNRIVVMAGANGRFNLDETQLAQHLMNAECLIMQFEVPMAQVMRAAKVAHGLGCKVVLNPSPAQALPEALWRLVDTLIVNESEAFFLTGLLLHTDPEIAAEVGRRLRERGVSRVVVTMGALGVVATDAVGSIYHPAPKVHAVDTTAAGDTFLGVVTVALAQKQSLTASVELGIRAATLCVQTRGAQPSIPTRAEVLQTLPSPPWRTL